MDTQHPQLTLWQFTVENAKDAVRLYFAPVRRIAALFTDEPTDTRQVKQEVEVLKQRLERLEQRSNPSLPALDDIELRVARLRTLAADGALNHVGDLLAFARLLLKQPGHQAELNQVLTRLEEEVKQIELDLGVLKNLRTHGASGD